MKTLKYIILGVILSSLVISSFSFSTSKNSSSQDEKLTFCETLFLVGKEAIKIKDSKTKQKVGFEALLKRFQSVDKDAWVRYLIYRDLRSRGYVAREGFGMGIDFRLYERGDYGKETAKHLIFGIQEGQPVTLETLARTQRYTQNLKKNLVLAVINRRGEIVYYSLSELNLK